MNKITDEHLNRCAYVYIRQSTQYQVKHNLESKRRQYSLENIARDRGFHEVIVLDEDLAKSGSGCVERSGFERLLNEVCQGKVGAVFTLEAQRLARNGREWHTLLEVCGLLGTLIIDFEGIYDPRLPNDRLFLGMKGILSEMELSTMRQRSYEALCQKARRGELFLMVGVGFVKTKDGRLEKDPDKHVQEAMSLVFRKLTELGSARQVVMWFRREEVKLPKVFYGDEGRYLRWELPTYTTILQILRNPIYGGAYAFGRTYVKVLLKDGKKRKVTLRQRDQKKWKVLIKDHHEGYICWDEYQRNQELIDHNANIRGGLVRGSAKAGRGLLQGLLRCGHCGRRLCVVYSGVKGQVDRYQCVGREVSHGIGKCISFGARRVNDVVVKAVLEALSPLGIEASIDALKRVEDQEQEVRRQKELVLLQARYEADRAKRQFDSVEPENRLVVSELERRWNHALLEVKSLEEEIDCLPEPEEITAEEREELLSLGEDLEYIWNHEAAPYELKKRILRTVLKEIVVKVEGDLIKLVLHWQGGEHTQLEVKKNRSGAHRWKTDVDTIKLIEGLSRIMRDRYIASLLNRLGKRTVKGKSWREAYIRVFRSTHGIAVYREGELKERGEMKVREAASELQVSQKILYRLIKQKVLPAKQVCKGAPWIIREGDLRKEQVLFAVQMAKRGKNIPLPDDEQMLFLYNTTT